MITRLAESPGLKLDEDFRGRFLQSKISNVGLDLISIALKQGRDHGLPGYTVIRKLCGLPKIYTFNELEADLVEPLVADQLATVYESVDDIDLLVGLMAERPLKGSFVGPSLGCLIANQFYKVGVFSFKKKLKSFFVQIRRGDRFWYENYFAPSAFTEDQLNQIRGTTLSRLVCDQTKVDQLQPLVFMKPNLWENSPLKCDSNVFPKMDITAWRDHEAQLQLPISRETIQKVFKLAELNLMEQRRRESKNIQKSEEEIVCMFLIRFV